MEIPQEIMEGVANIIRALCNKENEYKFYTRATIGEYNYKIKIELQEVDEVKEAKIASIIIIREEN
jgi:hypothetical protein